MNIGLHWLQRLYSQNLSKCGEIMTNSRTRVLNYFRQFFPQQFIFDPKGKEYATQRSIQKSVKFLRFFSSCKLLLNLIPTYFCNVKTVI